MPADKVIQHRQGTATLWTTTNPVLAIGEIGYETDTGKFKFGDGSSSWTSLSYAVPTGSVSDSFATIAVSGQDSVIADSSTDTLTFVAGSNIEITTDATADSITIAADSGAPTISDSAPSSPSQGDQWYSSSTGKQYIYYDSYWVEISSAVSGSNGTTIQSSTSAPTSGDGNNGDLWIVYS